MVVQLQSHSEEEMIASALDNVSVMPSFSPICEMQKEMDEGCEYGGCNCQAPKST